MTKAEKNRIKTIKMYEDKARFYSKRPSLAKTFQDHANKLKTQHWHSSSDHKLMKGIE